METPARGSDRLVHYIDKMRWPLPSRIQILKLGLLYFDEQCGLSVVSAGEGLAGQFYSFGSAFQVMQCFLFISRFFAVRWFLRYSSSSNALWVYVAATTNGITTYYSCLHA